MSNSEHLIKNFYPFIARPASYLGNELNSIVKKVEEIQICLALVHTDVYELGVNDFDFEQLYYHFNALAGVQAVRAFFPDWEAESVLRSARIPLFGLENKQPLAACQVVALYVPTPLHFLNTLAILELSGISAKKSDRSDNGPLVVGIGPALLNPEPVADLFDIIVPGASPQPLKDVVSRLATGKTAHPCVRSELLPEISRIEGIYIPEFYEPEYNSLKEFAGFRKLHSAAPDSISVSRVPKRAAENFQVQPLLPLLAPNLEGAAVAKMLSPSFSRHDFPAWEGISPARSLWTAFAGLLANREGTDALIMRLNGANHALILWRMTGENAWIAGRKISLWPHPDLKRLLANHWNELVRQFKRSGLVLNLVAGSTRLRRMLNLNLSESEILTVVSAGLESGWNRISLAFQFGLPGEKDADIQESLALLRRLADLAKNFPDSRIQVELFPFIPVPNSPLQWEGFCPAHQLHSQFRVFEENLAGLQFGLKTVDPHQAALQAAFGRGDRRLLVMIQQGWKAGLRYQGPTDESVSPAWQEFFAAHRQEIDPLLRPVSITRNLPWDHINAGPAKSAMKEEKSRVLRLELSPAASHWVGLGLGAEQQNLARWLRPEAVPAAGAQTGERAASSSAEGSPTLRFGRQSRRHSTAKVFPKKRIRVLYSRQRLAAFLNGPALLRAFELAARRAGVHLVYTQGRIPRPRIFLGPGLSAGISGRQELLDMEVTVGNPVSLQRDMNKYLPDGLRVLDARVLFAKLPGLSAVINLSGMKLICPESGLPRSGWSVFWKQRKFGWSGRAKPNCGR